MINYMVMSTKVKHSEKRGTRMGRAMFNLQFREKETEAWRS